MTMDGMEVVGTHPHAATSPFLLSSPPLGHHHHHHATFNLQAVQLSFDACLAYSSPTSSTTPDNVVAQSGGAPPGAIANSSTSANVSCKPLLTLSCTPLQMHDNNNGQQSSDSSDLQISSHSMHHSNHSSQHHHSSSSHHHQQQQQIESRYATHHHHSSSNRHHQDAPASPRDSANDLKRHHHHRQDEDNINKKCAREDERIIAEKDKPGDLNTPVTTSSDLPSFFGPSALVEPPPISGIQYNNYINCSWILFFFLIN